MAAEQNVKLVQDVYAAFMRGDLEAILNVVSDDIAFTVPGPPQMPTASTWRGLTGMRQFFAKFAESVEFTAFNPREYVASGDRVVVLGDYTGRIRRNGKTVVSDWVMAWRIRDGKIVEFREFNDTLAIAEAFDAVTRTAAV